MNCSQLAMFSMNVILNLKISKNYVIRVWVLWVGYAENCLTGSGIATDQVWDFSGWLLSSLDLAFTFLKVEISTADTIGVCSPIITNYMPAFWCDRWGRLGLIGKKWKGYLFLIPAEKGVCVCLAVTVQGQSFTRLSNIADTSSWEMNIKRWKSNSVCRDDPWQSHRCVITSYHPRHHLE